MQDGGLARPWFDAYRSYLTGQFTTFCPILIQGKIAPRLIVSNRAGCARRNLAATGRPIRTGKLGLRWLQDSYLFEKKGGG